MKLLLSAGATLAFVVGLCAAETPKNLRVHIVSWNSGAVSAPQNLEEFLGFKDNPDVIAVAAQGHGFKHNRDTHGPACVKNFQNLLSTKYNKLNSTITDTMGLIVYAKKEHTIEKLKMHHEPLKKNRKIEGIISRFAVYGKRFSFTTTRRESEDDKIKTNNHAYDKLLDSTLINYAPDFLFWMGDLNFRVDMNANEAKGFIDNNELNKVMEKDQLKIAMKGPDIFPNWIEPKITFNPTYKFKPNTDEYDLSTTPSWTDRVLFISGTGQKISPISYNSLNNYKQTEHRPVLAMFTLTL